MIHSSVFLERWRGDCWPDAKWCACDIERIEAIQKDSMLTILAMVSKALQNHCDPSVRSEIANLCVEIEGAINDTFSKPKVPQETNLEDVLPSIVGNMEMSHGDFQRACQVLLQEFQQDPHRHSGGVIQVLCEAVRCSRECCHLSSELQSLAAKVLENAKSQGKPL